MGGKPWIVHVHKLPRVPSSFLSVLSEVHRGHPDCAGKTVAPQSRQIDPISFGSSEGQVNNPSSIGTLSPMLLLNFYQLSMPSNDHYCMLCIN